ncbi:hypothetical protein HK405_009471 [Cladochytrium tenue]|nr:hypothetical protein HK405_009471 [Cladochytrium tenue]
MIRLTGRHPFNSEAPLEAVMEAAAAKRGLTPNALHYVRNHGSVPKLDWDTHVLEIEFAVDALTAAGNPAVSGCRTRQFTMRELARMGKTAVAVTLTCAGNRRHEQNVVKKSQGFSWGPSAASTAVWSGVPLHSLLSQCGVDMARLHSSDDAASERPLYVNFAGSDKLPKGVYGTTTTLQHAMDPTGDILLAYEMNGERLPPDHGFPLRVIIPGWIGGRMVKWLGRITISDKETESTYHFEDNRVLPPNIGSSAQAFTTTSVLDPYEPDAPGKKVNWWRRPEFIINERNINSVIASPAHGSVLDLSTCASASGDSGGSGERTFRVPVQGYAYSGGGRRVTRVELSVDDGRTWTLAPRVVHSGGAKASASSESGLAPRHGVRYWCWFLWDVEVELTLPEIAWARQDGGNDDVPAGEVVQVAEVLVRCWDAAQNTQPRDITWNLLGMMNNNWYRVKLVHDPSSGKLHWEHPTNIGESKEAGWMARDKRAAEVASSSDASVASTGDAESRETRSEPVARKPGLPSMTMDEVAAHNSESDCWVVIDGVVLDVTKFLKRHPGGVKSLMIAAGSDATDDFYAIHGAAAAKMKDKFAIGYVDGRSG